MISGIQLIILQLKLYTYHGQAVRDLLLAKAGEFSLQSRLARYAFINKVIDFSYGGVSFSSSDLALPVVKRQITPHT
jgi:hypothetical protein